MAMKYRHGDLHGPARIERGPVLKEDEEKPYWLKGGNRFDLRRLSQGREGCSRECSRRSTVESVRGWFCQLYGRYDPMAGFDGDIRRTLPFFPRREQGHVAGSCKVPYEVNVDMTTSAVQDASQIKGLSGSFGSLTCGRIHTPENRDVWLWLARLAMVFGFKTDENGATPSSPKEFVDNIESRIPTTTLEGYSYLRAAAHHVGAFIYINIYW
ncbi:hypothetical protein DFH94DRAFT_815342 [Russula ochroleuca]|uniref:Uncharacterized protein n=1 Tax=Russula ochroleuca TaxID=152965 RepID=A0A9P5TCH4_9AGAM|nr:hypothetical protein DFH94DRAFT_815342 [Russula ochroleuca]